MPRVIPNTKLNLSIGNGSGEIVALKMKGQSITLRLAGYPGYYGQHWIIEGGKKKPVPCARVNSPDISNPNPCDYCDRFLAGEDDLKPTVSFIFPALDRKSGKPILFDTRQQVWKEMENQESKGIRIFDYDWLVERTENKPKYYEVTRLEKDPLDTAQAKAYAEAKALDVDKFIESKIGFKKSKEDIVIDDSLIDENLLAEIDNQVEEKEEMPF